VVGSRLPYAHRSVLFLVQRTSVFFNESPLLQKLSCWNSSSTMHTHGHVPSQTQSLRALSLRGVDLKNTESVVLQSVVFFFKRPPTVGGGVF
jgi:hypothetical protein